MSDIFFFPFLFFSFFLLLAALLIMLGAFGRVTIGRDDINFNLGE